MSNDEKNASDSAGSPVFTLLVLTSLSRAAVIYEYGTLATGTAPAGLPSWATLTIEDYAPNQVKMTLQADLQGSDECIRTLWLNIDPFVSVSLVSADTSGGSDVVSVNALSNGHNAPGGEQFDLEVNLPNAGLSRLTGTEWVSWVLQGSGLTANHFLAKTYDKGLYYTMIHVQGIGYGDGSGKLSGLVVSQPGTIWLFALGITAIPPMMRRCRRG